LFALGRDPAAGRCRGLHDVHYSPITIRLPTLTIRVGQSSF